MPQELGLPKFWKYSECKPGTQLVKKGKFVGVTEGKYGAQYNFVQLDDNQHVVLNKAGQFEWRVEQGHMNEGDVFDIFFDGKEVIEKGQFAGKEANKFKILKYDDAELGLAPKDEVAAEATPTGKLGKTTTRGAGKGKAPATAEALDGLE